MRVGCPSLDLRTVKTALLITCFTILGVDGLFGASISDTIKNGIRRRVDYHYNTGVVIGIVDQDGRDFFSYGTTNLEKEQLPNEHTAYEIGSISKVFTASLFANMTANGEVSYEDPVASHLPQEVSVPEHSRTTISLEHLATHRSGLPANPPALLKDDPINVFFPFPTDALYDFLGEYQLTRSPGTEYEYSNLGMGLLGHALSRRLELSYEEALQERILGPLGMDDTAVVPSEDLSARRAQGYTGIAARPAIMMDSLEGAAALVSTASDMLTFLEYQLELRDSELNPAFREAHQPRFPAGSPLQKIGLGWHVTQLGSDTITMHDGATMGHHAFAGFNRRTGTGVVVLTNARLNQYSSVQDLGMKALVPAFPLTATRRPATITEDELRRFPGLYEGPDETDLDIKIEQGHLTVTNSKAPNGSFTLYPLSTRRFQLYEALGTASVNFAFDTEERVTGIQWREGDVTTDFTRLRTTPKLTLAFSHQDLQIELSGDGDITHTIESSPDLHKWSPMTTMTIWDPPLVISNPEGDGNRFFRVR
jgi:D-alanyl-D-alanine-carboxypeptidase/D-alanyl-D-alanine-endopeptidase